MTDPKIKVLLTLPFFYPHKGGSQKYAEEIYTRLLLTHPNLAVDVLCYNTDNTLDVESYRGMPIYRIPCINILPGRFALPNPFKLKQLLQKLKENNYDFVNAHIRFFDTTWWTWKYAKRIGAKSIYTEHVPGHPVHENPFVGAIAKLVDTLLGYSNIKKYDIYTAVNPASLNFLQKHIRINKPLIAVNIGVNLENFEVMSKKLLRTIPTKTDTTEISPETVLISYVGRMLETKGVQVLYDAVSQLKEQTPDVAKNLKVVFAGSGPLEEQIRTRAAEEGLNKLIDVTGNLEYKDVMSLMKATDIFVSPSTQAEGLPNTLLEAAAARCAIITTESGSIGDLIKDGVTGIFVQRGNASNLAEVLMNLVQNEERRNSLGTAAHDLVEQDFNLAKSAEKLYEVLKTNLRQQI